MKFNVLFFVVLGLTSVSIAESKKASSADCEIMNTKLLEMETFAVNIENVNTTSTPEGGPYKRKEIVCKKQMCAELSYGNTITKNIPGHPDADKDGNVKFPDIDVAKEMQLMIDARGIYEQASRNCKKLNVAVGGKI